MWTNGTQWRGTSVGIGCAGQVPHTISTSTEAVSVHLQRAAGLNVACAVHGVTFHGAEMVVRDELAWLILVPLTPIMRVARFGSADSPARVAASPRFDYPVPVSWSTDDMARKVEALRGALRRFGCERAILFGSAARGDQHEGSDLDVIVPGPREHARTEKLPESHLRLAWRGQAVLLREPDRVTERIETAGSHDPAAGDDAVRLSELEARGILGRGRGRITPDCGRAAREPRPTRSPSCSVNAATGDKLTALPSFHLSS